MSCLECRTVIGAITGNADNLSNGLAIERLDQDLLVFWR